MSAVLTLAALEEVLAARGLTPRGAFHPTAIDEVPALADGSAAATLVLAGNAGPAMWDAFARARGFADTKVVTCGRRHGCNEFVFRREDTKH